MRPLPLLALLLALPAAAEPAPVRIELSWDRELAFEHDRESYGRQLRAWVEESYAMASAETGLSLHHPLRVYVLTPAQFERQFGAEAAFSQGARYAGGAIYLNGGNRFTDRLAGLLVHEMTHAVLDHRGTGGRLPLWLNEGLAERLGWKRKGLDDLAPDQKATLQAELRERHLVPLPAFGQLRFPYLQCYAAVLYLERTAGKQVLLAVVRRTLDGEPFERALDAETRWTVEDLEAGFSRWVDHL